MKQAFVFLLVVGLIGCTTNRAIVPSLEGKPRVKINTAMSDVPPIAPVATSVETFDFSFSGDIRAAVKALKVVQPQINLIILSGEPFPLNVNVNLRGVTLQEALHSIGKQGRDNVDVILSKPQHQSGYQVLVRFNPSKEQ